MKLKRIIYNTLFFALLLTPVLGVGQPSVSNESFSVIKEAYSYDKALPLKATLFEVKQYPTFTRTTIHYSGVRERVGAYLAIPKKGTEPFPVVLLIDGMGGSKERWFKKEDWPNGLETVEALLEKGFAVFTIDAAMHGERFDSTGVFPKPALFRKKNLMYSVHDIIKQTVQDYRRGLDFLETREEIDIGKVGAYGLSMGGAITFILTGLEERVKAAVVGVAVVYGNNNSLVNAYNFTPRITTKPVLMLMGDHDGYYTPESATQLFNTIGGEHNKLIIFEGGHKMPPSYIPMIADWFVYGLR